MYKQPRRSPPAPVDPMAPLRWGYNQGLPRTGSALDGWIPGWSAAWGARAQLLGTVTGGQLVHVGYAMVADWQSSTGPVRELDRLLDNLKAGGHDLWLAEANRALHDGRLVPASMDETTLHEGPLGDQQVTVKASHEGTEGWLYVVAYTTR